MLIRLILLASVLVAGLVADDAPKAVKAAKILELTRADRMVDQMRAQIVVGMDNMIRQMAPEISQGPLAEDLRKDATTFAATQLDWNVLKGETVKIYVDTFTDQELDELIRFYSSPTGQALVEKLPIVMGKASDVAQSRLQAALPAFQQKVMEKVQKQANQEKPDGVKEPGK